MASWLNENVVDLGTIEFGGENGLVSWHPGMPKSAGKPVIPDSVLPEKPETGLGQITNDAAQLVVGLVGAGKVLKVAEGASVLLGSSPAPRLRRSTKREPPSKGGGLP